MERMNTHSPRAHRNRKILCALMCVCLLPMLTSCKENRYRANELTASFPKAETTFVAPDGDRERAEETEHMLYLPSTDGVRLLGRHTPLMMTGSETDDALTLVNALLNAEADEKTLRVGGNVSLQLYGEDPVEVSNGVCTVNLGSSALQLESRELYTMGLAMAATLCETETIGSVNLLVADRAVGMDINDNFPLGSLMPRLNEEIPTLWDQLSARMTPVGEDPAVTAYSGSATLFFPLADGSGFMPEVRTLTFSGQTPQILAKGLIDALSEGAMYLTDVAEMPNIGAMMTHSPLVTELAEGGRLITLSFRNEFAKEVSAIGVNPDCLISAVAYTLMTYIPGVTNVNIRVAENELTGMRQAESGTGFAGGLMNRNQLTDRLVSRKIIYLTDGKTLIPVSRALPRKESDAPRSLFNLLMGGVTDDEEAEGIMETLPPGLTADNVLGIALVDDRLLINLDEQFAQEIIRFGKDKEQLLCYSIVNTLCLNTGATSVTFFFESEQRETLAGLLYWAGQFIYNPGIDADNAG